MENELFVGMRCQEPSWSEWPTAESVTPAGMLTGKVIANLLWAAGLRTDFGQKIKTDPGLCTSNEGRFFNYFR